MKAAHPPVFLPDPAATEHLARALAARLAGGDVVLLSGPIGAGKTHFARALIKTFVDEPVPSPTFTLVQTYDAPRFEIWHADLYRLTHPDEAVELGLTEAFEAALCLVEWPEKLGRDRPEQALTVQFSPLREGREVQFLSDNPAWTQRLKGIADV